MDGTKRVVGVFLASLWAAVVAADSTGLAVSEPWVREVPPVSSMTAAYLVLENSGMGARALVGAESPDFEQAELHRTVTAGGVARMEAQPRIDLPPGSRLTFEPGGYHVMLMGFRHPLRPGDTVRLTLRFADGAALEVSAPVRPADAPDDTHHHGHQH